MKTIAMILGWFVLIILMLAAFTGLTLIALAAFDELKDRIKNKLKK